MKRVLTILAILLLPLSVWAMTPVSDSDLSNVTGQAGVNINADLTMNIEIGTMAWGDDDGLTPSAYNPWSPDSGAGYIGVENFSITNLVVKARTGDTYNGYNPFSTTTANRLKPITIDVGTGAPYAAGVTYVRMGLGSLQITMDDMDFTVGLASSLAVGADDLDQELGQVHIGGFGLYISPFSYIDIYNDRTTAGNQGVTISMFVQIDHMDLDEVSWGDADGLGVAARNIWYGTAADTTEGWIGLTDIVMGPITVSGTMKIDVATVSGGVYGAQALVSAVRIDFASFNVNVVGPITANVKIGDVSTLDASATRTMGDIYLSGFDLTLNGWVDIWAH